MSAVRTLALKHKLVQYFHTLYSNKDKDILQGIHIAAFKVHLFSSTVEYCNIPNVNSYKSSYNQCSTIAAYTIYYSLQGIHISAFKVHLFSNTVEYCNIPNVNNYKSYYNQCSTIPAYTIYYSLINHCGYST